MAPVRLGTATPDPVVSKLTFDLPEATQASVPGHRVAALLGCVAPMSWARPASRRWMARLQQHRLKLRLGARSSSWFWRAL
jgi:hypothetical protein